MEILIILILILINGLFSMSEIALVSARKSRLEGQAKRGNTRAKAALELAASPTRFLSTVQIGITLIGILTGIYSGQNITDDLQAWLADFEFLAEYAHGLAVGIVVVIITLLSLILGELVPKRIGMANPEAIASALAIPMRFISKVVSPFVWLLTSVTELIVRVFRIKPSDSGKVTEEEIKAIVQEGTTTGEVQQIEQNIVERVFILGDRKVSSLMTYRNEVVSLHLNDNNEELRKLVSKDLHSVYPVYEENDDEIVGVILLKDLFVHLSEPDFKIATYLQSPNFISDNIPAYRALEIFKETGKHYAIAIDEYGQMKGLLTINDVLTALVGTVDEFYKGEFSLVEREDGSLLIDGDYPMHDFLHYFNMDDLASEFSFNTISGLIISEMKKIPSAGDKISWHQLDLEVIDMDGARIDKILVTERK